MRPERPTPPIGAAAAGRPAEVAAPVRRRPDRDVRRRAAAWLIAAGVVLGAIALLQTPPALRALHGIGARGPDAGFTEVTLARAPSTADGVVSFAVGVHDVQGRPVRYRWSLATIGGRVSGPLPSGELLLQDGERRTVPVRVRVHCAPGTTRMFVGARVEPYPAASVGSWVSCDGAAS
jgi:hypothetical protein